MDRIISEGEGKKSRSHLALFAVGGMLLMDGCQNSWKEVNFHLDELHISLLFQMINFCSSNLSIRSSLRHLSYNHNRLEIIGKLMNL